jgi:hypothetical protein
LLLHEATALQCALSIGISWDNSRLSFDITNLCVGNMCIANAMSMVGGRYLCGIMRECLPPGPALSFRGDVDIISSRRFTD